MYYGFISGKTKEIADSQKGDSNHLKWLFEFMKKQHNENVFNNTKNYKFTKKRFFCFAVFPPRANQKMETSYVKRNRAK